jgi:hypothetical protein
MKTVYQPRGAEKNIKPICFIIRNDISNHKLFKGYYMYNVTYKAMYNDLNANIVNKT